MKKLFGYILGILLGTGFVSANTTFLQLLDSRGVDTETLLQATTVPRETVTEFLNLVDCQDCHRPSKDMIGSLSQSWWNAFRLYPGNNFDDVDYNTSTDANNDYYCIAYVGNKGYMNGFPRSTSPVCSGKFCGDDNITNADIIQTVFNITSKLFYSQYKADWAKMGNRLNAQGNDVKRYFGLEDLASIELGKKQCSTGPCTIDSTDGLETYVKYCTYESADCGMQEFPFAKQGKRPIAEMNILVQQGIFTTDDLQNLNIEDYARGSFIVDILGRVKERAQCVDNDDQDNDGIKDYQDNCYTTYNPKQRDTDGDKIGDVCDDDIDNDTIKNPIGIVDDDGNIVYDSLQNGQNALSEVIGLAIQQSKKQGDEYAFTAVYVGKLKDFSWDFGDGKSGQGIDVSHLYTAPGIYIVHLTAKDTKGKIIEAVSTIVVGGGDSGVGLSIKQTKTTGNTYNFTPVAVGNLKDYVWDFGDGKTGNGEQVTHTYTTAGTYTVRLTAKDSKGNLISAVSTVLVSASDSVGLSIKQTKTTGNTYNFTPVAVGNLKDYVWDFGDGKTGNGEQVTHTYTTAGTYTVRLTAKDSTGKTITATTQIVVVQQPTTAAVAIRASLMPSKLTQNIGENVQYSILLEGVTLDAVDYVKLSRGDGRKKELRGNSITKFTDAYSRDGKYLIEGTVYLKNVTTLPLAAYITVLPAGTITKDTMDNCLFIVNTNQLDDDQNHVGNTCDITDRVGIRISPRPITQDRFAFVAQYSGSLKNFNRYFGDRTTGSGETTLHSYREPGQYTVRVEATTPKGTTISATTTVAVGGPRVALIPSKLVQNVGENVPYSLLLNNLQVSDIDYVDIQRGDGRTRQLRGKDITNFVDTYSTYGGYSIGGTVYLNNNNTLSIGSFVTVVGQYYCLGSVAGSWGNTCDMDKDTIPDTCDTDIDGDGVSNPLGLIRFTNKACTYDGTNTTIKPTVKNGTGATNNQDNCPFTSNPEQGPCAGLDKDTDGDGIPDIRDSCPAIAELFNGVEDTDGCPEYNFIVSFPSTKIQPGSCNVCPCQFAQNDSTVAPGDRVKAVLYDTSTQKPVAESSWYIVP